MARNGTRGLALDVYQADALQAQWWVAVHIYQIGNFLVVYLNASKDMLCSFRASRDDGPKR
jgi:hypothetical protein